MCGEAFRRRYLERDRRPAGTAALIGKAVHAGIELDLRHKMEHGELLSAPDVQDATSSAFDAIREKDGVALTDDELAKPERTVFGDAKDVAIDCASLYHQEVAPGVDPADLEVRLYVEIDDFPYDLIGYADIIEKDGTIRDTKTSGKSPGESAIAETVQMEFYAFERHVVARKAPPALVLDTIVKLRLRQIVMKPRAKRHIFINRQRKGVWSLKHHTSALSEVHQVYFFSVKRFAFYINLAVCTNRLDGIVHSVERTN